MGTVKRVDQVIPLPETTWARVDPSVQTSAPTERFPRELLDEIAAQRERLFDEHGLFPDSSEGLRELRDSVSGS